MHIKHTRSNFRQNFVIFFPKFQIRNIICILSQVNKDIYKENTRTTSALRCANINCLIMIDINYYNSADNELWPYNFLQISILHNYNGSSVEKFLRLL